MLRLRINSDLIGLVSTRLRSVKATRGGLPDQSRPSSIDARACPDGGGRLPWQGTADAAAVIETSLGQTPQTFGRTESMRRGVVVVS